MARTYKHKSKHKIKIKIKIMIKINMNINMNIKFKINKHRYGLPNIKTQRHSPASNPIGQLAWFCESGLRLPTLTSTRGSIPAGGWNPHIICGGPDKYCG
eukprot:TRINITY_DN82513_c0_g1_i1.p4 TRINITY_DN82513_c0_g1~~TRINITY_DN82513_c0_g1_i1.p4  ORF type:complete len:100 (+),score=11.97 TRINITY_DN82513_c0_g1_i1:94-393(+)